MDVLLLGKICVLWLIIEKFIDQALLARNAQVQGDISSRINAIPGIKAGLRASLHSFRQCRNSLMHPGTLSSLTLEQIEELGSACLLQMQREFQGLVNRMVPRYKPEEYGMYAIVWLQLETEVVGHTKSLPSTATALERINSIGARARKDTINSMHELRAARNGLLHDDVRRFSTDVFSARVEACIASLRQDLREGNEILNRVSEAWSDIPPVLVHVYFSVLLRRLRAGQCDEFRMPALWRPGRWVGQLLPEDAFKVVAKHVPTGFMNAFWPAAALRSQVECAPHAPNTERWLAAVKGLLAALNKFSRGGEVVVIDVPVGSPG